jgi:hypothetical protein
MNHVLSTLPSVRFGLRVIGAALLVIGSCQAFAKSPQATYESECSACHIAYPAGLLTAPAWDRIVGGLKTHFGADASLDDASRKAVASYLNSNAGTDSRIAERTQHDRITETAWFRGRHGEVSRSVWARASVHSPSNCSACHRGAAKGDFDEDNVRIPG